MKKVLLSLGLALGFTYVAQAQIAFGVKAGGSLTNFTGSGAPNNDYKFGFHAGLQADFSIVDNFSIHPEIFYSMKGAKASGSFGSIKIEETQSLHYIDVPIMARLKADQLFFEAGPQFGLLVGANDETTGGGQSTSANNKSDFNGVDFGFAAGFGYQMTEGIGAGLRYNAGLIDIVNKNAGDATHNGGFQLYLSYMFASK